ncbi:MAG: histidinol dehydrogenase [Ginsengibacter sp.]
MQIIINPVKDKWPGIIKRPAISHDSLQEIVEQIVNDVKQNGDEAVKKYNLKFDGVEQGSIQVSEQEFLEADYLVSDELKKAIVMARGNIEKFHMAQFEETRKIETSPGVFCWRKSVPISKVGLYIPGGTAPLFSTLLMLGIPAMMAGCNIINVCTPPGKDGKINPVILFVAKMLGLKSVYKTGGVQAIAAMAYGTSSIPAVYKIFGPGNQFVTAAKQRVSMDGIAIDMPAGPSEIAIYADATADPSFVASDLLSQAEHGADSQVLLVASSREIIEKVQAQVSFQVKNLSRKEIISQSLQNSRFIVMEGIEDAFELLNAYAPEHLVIASQDAEQLADKVVNAGSVFLGHYAPESAGDYASGTNHTLPTNGFANTYSGVSLDSFMKKITFQQLTREGLTGLSVAIQAMAEAEGLDAHARSVSIRLTQ